MTKGYVTISINEELHNRLNLYLFEAQYRRQQKMSVRQIIEEALEEYLANKQPSA